MKSIKQLIRLMHISMILARNGLDQVLVTIPVFSPLRFFTYFNPYTWVRKKAVSRGEALRKTLEELGPIFVKFGQALSTRPDILATDIAEELCRLQDNVPPFSSEIAVAIIEKTFKRPVSDIFAEFNREVLASASMAQVHAAVLPNGDAVVVKILRPNIEKIIAQDISILRSIANTVDRYWVESKRLKPKEIVEEFAKTLYDELDLQREAGNASQLRRNFNNSPLLYIPEVYWDYTRTNIMVMERIHGIPIADIETLKAYQINLKQLAERGVEIFFTQVFRDRFFHADMHPGNIFVSYQHPHDPQYIGIDFGIIGTLSNNDKQYLAENLYAFFDRNYYRVAELHVESGWVAPNTRIEEFESAIRTVCEPIFEKPLKDISFAQLVIRLFQVARRFQMEVQPQLILLQKTLLSIEGLGRQLYPELDLWSTAKPFLEKWLKEQIGPKTFLHQMKENLPFFAEQLPNMPRLLQDVLSLTKKQQLLTLRPLPSPPQRLTSWRKGFGVGLFVTMASMSILDYCRVIMLHEIMIPTTLFAIVGVILALYPIRRTVWD